jgi:MFS family permease
MNYKDDEPPILPATPLPLKDGRGTLMSDLRELPRAFWVLFTGTFINRFGTFVMPFLAIYLTREGYTIAQAGLAISAYGAGALLASLIGGHLADTIGRRHTMVLGSWSAAVTLIVLYYASGLTAIITVSALNGFANALYSPAASALIADLVPDRLRVRAFAGLRFAVNAGFGFGSAAAGLLAKYSFAWLFYGDALTLVIFGAIALAFLPHGVRHQRGGHGYIPWSFALRRIFRDRAFVAMFVSALLCAIVFSQFNTSYGLEVERRGFDTTIYGALLAMNGLMVILFELPLTSLTMRFSPKRVIALGYAVLGGGFALNTFGNSLTILFLSMALFTVGEMIAMPMQSAYVARIAPRELRGRYNGAMSMAWSCASMIGPAAGMWIFSNHHDALWLACGAFGMLAAAVMLGFGARVHLDDDAERGYAAAGNHG